MKRITKAAVAIVGVVIVLSIGMVIICRSNPGLLGKLSHLEYRDIYGYGDSSTGIMNIDTGNRRLVINDYAIAADFCGNSEPYYCVKGPGFHFAVPRDSSKNFWDVAGFHYEIAHEASNFVGTKKPSDSVVIRSTDQANGAEDFEYLYSPTWGLIGFYKQNREVSLRGCTGFGGTKSGSLLGYLSNDCWEAYVPSVR